MTGTQERSKGLKIQRMFDELAPRYDLMNRVMTLGQDQRWRRFVVDRARPEPRGRLLDLASGTGDIAFEAIRRFPRCRVVAGDFSVGMLRRGMARRHGDRLCWVACDAAALPFADASFDAVTFGYLLRNVARVDQVLSEIYRVLKPGGRVVCLDTAPPPPGLLRPFVRLYLRRGLPLLGRLFAGNSGSYAYLSNSTMAFQSPPQLRNTLLDSGFEAVSYRTFMLGTIAVHWGLKGSESGAELVRDEGE